MTSSPMTQSNGSKSTHLWWTMHSMSLNSIALCNQSTVSSWVSQGSGRFRGPSTCYFRVKYGPTALRASRLELGGDVYAMVLESWEVTRRVIHDPFTAFTDSLLSRFFMVSNPILLYTMDTAGIPTNPAYLTSAAPSPQGSSMELRAICAEIDDVQQQGITAMGSVTNSIQRFQTVTSELVEQGNHTVAALSAHASPTGTMCLFMHCGVTK